MPLKIIVTGPTGLVGSEVIRQALNDPNIIQITALARRPLNITHEKLTTIIHKDYLNYSNISDIFKAHNACVWCLGISQSQVSEEEYIKITYDYTITAAAAILQSNPKMIFMFVSGEGTQKGENSRFLFGRIKSRTEKSLQELPYQKLYIIRPAGIRPVTKNPNTAFANKMIIPFYPLVEFLFPRHVIKSTDLAVAMLKILKEYTSHFTVLVDTLDLTMKNSTCEIIGNEALRALAKDQLK